MSGSYTEGGARPTLTAHSKDGSTRGSDTGLRGIRSLR
jgi:hypothetical protein